MQGGNVLKSYQIGLGFQFDEAALRKFHEGIARVHTSVKNFSLSMVGLAVAVEESVRRTANSYTELFYLAEKTGASAQNLKSLGYAFTQIGLQANQAGQALAGIASAFRDDPGVENYLKGVIGDFQGAEGALKAIAKRYKEILAMPASEGRANLERQFRDIIRENARIDPEMARQQALHFEEMGKRQLEAQKIYRKFNLDIDEATGRSKKATEEWNKTWLYIGAGFDKLIVTVMPTVSRLFERFADWMEKEGSVKITQWIDDLEDFLEDLDIEGIFNDIKAGLNTAMVLFDKVIWFVKLLNEYLGTTGTLLVLAFAPSIISGLISGLAGGLASGLMSAAIGGGVATAGAGLGGTFAGAFVRTAIAAIGGTLGVGIFAALATFFTARNAGSQAEVEGDKRFGQEHGVPLTPALADKLLQQGTREGTLSGNERDNLESVIRKAGKVPTTSIPGWETGALGPEATRPNSYTGPPIPTSPFSSGNVAAIMESLYMGFQHWWAGSGAFRPLVVISDEFYERLTDTLREVFGLSPMAGMGTGEGSRGGAPGGGGGGGAPNAGAAGGGRMPGRVQPGGGEAGTGEGPAFPVTGRLSSEYGADRPAYVGQSGAVGSHIHAGVDLAAPIGSPVGSTKEGTVISAGWHQGYGNTVDILHADGRFERHAHLANVVVKAGDKIKAGQQLGQIGTEGHDHFEVHTHYDRNNAAANYGRTTTIDPAEYFGGLRKGQTFRAGQGSGTNRQGSPTDAKGPGGFTSGGIVFPAGWKPDPNAPSMKDSAQDFSHTERMNPGNLRVGGGGAEGWEGQNTKPGEAFESFSSVMAGIRARAITYKSYIEKAGANTIAAIAARSGPASDNNDMPSQIATYKRAMGGKYAEEGGENLPIEATPENLRRLTRAGISFEVGGHGNWLPKGAGNAMIDKVFQELAEAANPSRVAANANASTGTGAKRFSDAMRSSVAQVASSSVDFLKGAAGIDPSNDYMKSVDGMRTGLRSAAAASSRPAANANGGTHIQNNHYHQVANLSAAERAAAAVSNVWDNKSNYGNPLV